MNYDSGSGLGPLKYKAKRIRRTWTARPGVGPVAPAWPKRA